MQSAAIQNDHPLGGEFGPARRACRFVYQINNEKVQANGTTSCRQFVTLASPGLPHTVSIETVEDTRV